MFPQMVSHRVTCLTFHRSPASHHGEHSLHIPDAWCIMVVTFRHSFPFLFSMCRVLECSMSVESLTELNLILFGQSQYRRDIFPHILLYRVFHDLWTLLQEVIS